jgi:hypothetical protein
MTDTTLIHRARPRRSASGRWTLDRTGNLWAASFGDIRRAIALAAGFWSLTVRRLRRGQRWESRSTALRKACCGKVEQPASLVTKVISSAIEDTRDFNAAAGGRSCSGSKALTRRSGMPG